MMNDETRAAVPTDSAISTQGHEQGKHTPADRLRRWRDVGDGPTSYTAGNDEFAADVGELLTERDEMLVALKVCLHALEAHCAGATPFERSAALAVIRRATNVRTDDALSEHSENSPHD